MSLRIFSGLLLVALSACGGADDDGATSAVEPAQSAERIACAVGDAEFADACTVDRAPAPGGTILTIRHADGGFRRVIVSTDGQSVSAADGAQPVTLIARSSAGLEFAIGDARYRLPPSR